MLELGIKFTFGYWIGAIMGALVMGRFAGGVDIRAAGSGNLGGTNALRTQGKWFALGVMLVDVGKGIFAAAVVPGLRLPGVSSDPSLDPALLLYGVAVAAVLGHVFPVWSGFRGGKGGATAAGLLCFLAPGLAPGILGVWFVIVFVTGYVGLATMTAAVTAAAFVAVTGRPDRAGFLVFACLVAALIVYTHRGNIRRMLNGTESRFGPFFGLGKTRV